MKTKHEKTIEILREFANQCMSPIDYDEFVGEYADKINQLEPEGEVYVPDDIREYIGKTMYDDHGQLIFRGADKDNLKQFLDVRGWGAIQNMGFKTIEEAEAFQDKVGKWVTDVINEKLTLPPQQPSEGEEVSDNQISVAYDAWYRTKAHPIYTEETFTDGAKWMRSKLTRPTVSGEEIIEVLNKYLTTDKPQFTDKFVDPFDFHKIAKAIKELNR